MTFLIIIQLLLSTLLTLPVISIVCKHKKHKIYKPGHIPEFENPENEETDTYYGLNSSRLFPDREKGRINRISLLEEEKGKTAAGTSASDGVVLSDTQPTKDKLTSVK